MNKAYQNTTARNLFLLFIVFIIGFGAQSILNLSISNFVNELDQKVRNSEVENLLGQEIGLEIHKIESDFFQMAAFPNKHLRKILLEDVHIQQEKISQALRVLNQGGTYRYEIELNIPDAPKQLQILLYEPETLNAFSFAAADIQPKFEVINQKMQEITQALEKIDALKQANSDQLDEALSQLSLEIKFFQPIFTRLKENANFIFYQNKQNFLRAQQEVENQKAHYKNIQIGLSLSLLLLTLVIFFTLSRNITKTLSQVEQSKDYSEDILNSQKNIIIVNDGAKIIDVSGGFYQFFNSYKTLEDFTEEYDCVCDLFIKEEGFVYKFEQIRWIDYILKHPEKIHKAKLLYQGKTSIFQVSVVKSEKYQRYIISMFDITENENNNQLIREQKDKALAATQAKGEFLANMSHEIRTPLNAILGFINLLKDKQHDEESQKYLETIDNSSHSLLGIINDILDFSKIESGKLDIDPVKFDPRKEFSSTADLFRARCSEKNISFKVALSEHLPNAVESDVLRIKQVLNNLLSNAVKFTEANNSICLTIEYENQCLKCMVEDQGIGMSEEAQERIFDAFSQAETSTTRQFGGTGLGLAISSKLVRMLGGELRVNSRLKQGSTFYFSIPAKVATGLKESTLTPKENQPYTGHILLVEDNKTNQLLMTAILKKQQISFDIAQDGFEALEAVQKKTYDLVLMDENMPNLNGIEATKRIRELEQAGKLHQNHIPIVALTANAMTGDRERFIAAGMDEYLAKPIEIDKLKQVFVQFLT